MRPITDSPNRSIVYTSKGPQIIPLACSVQIGITSCTIPFKTAMTTPRGTHSIAKVFNKPVRFFSNACISLTQNNFKLFIWAELDSDNMLLANDPTNFMRRYCPINFGIPNSVCPTILILCATYFPTTSPAASPPIANPENNATLKYSAVKPA